MRPLPPSLFLSAWLHGSLLGFFWLPSVHLWEMVEDMEEGAMVGAERMTGQALAATLSSLEPEDIHPVSITLIDPIPTLPGILPTTTTEVAPSSRPSRPTSELADTDGAETTGESGSFEADGKQGDGTSSRTKNRKPCEDRPGVWNIQSSQWGMQRSVVDYYAAHFPELDRQVGSEPYAGPDGRPIGLKIVLSRCSILKEAGLRSGDVIHSANGIRVHSYAQALGAWLRLRNSSRVKLEVTRKGQPLVLQYQVEG